jgi:hypothetical protein
MTNYQEKQMARDVHTIANNVRLRYVILGALAFPFVVVFGLWFLALVLHMLGF